MVITHVETRHDATYPSGERADRGQRENGYERDEQERTSLENVGHLSSRDAGRMGWPGGVCARGEGGGVQRREGETRRVLL